MQLVVNSFQFFSMLGTLKKLDLKILRSHAINNGGRSGTIIFPRKKNMYRRYYRYLDTKRFNLKKQQALVVGHFYDSMRFAKISLLCYSRGIFSFILSCEKLNIGDLLVNQNEGPYFKYGDSAELMYLPSGRLIHNLNGFARSAGVSIMLVRKENDVALLKMKSSELRFANTSTIATFGVVSGGEKIHNKIGSAGRALYIKKRRPRSRPSAMNPVDHPMGGRTRGGAQPVNRKGKITLNRSTVRKQNPAILYTVRQIKLLRR